MGRKSPYQFDEFFASGLEETVSPFLTKKSKNWGKNLSLKSAIIAALLLFFSFIVSFTLPSLGFLGLTFVYFLVGIPALISSLEDILTLEINIDILMTLAAFFSIIIGSGYEGALLLVLFEISGAMEDTVTHKAKGAIHSLDHLSPKMAYVKQEGIYLQRSVREIEVGTKILVKAGEIVPLDGIVEEGISSVNLVHLTGESLPIEKKIGDQIPSGAQNLDSALEIKVTRKSSDSTVSKIIALITSAQESKPKAQRFLDHFGKYYSTSVMMATLFFGLSLPFFISIPYFGQEGSIYRALSFMIAASPCALIIATPTAYLSAVSACARKGILLKGGVTLDALNSCKAIAFDKTGTLTLGKLVLRKIIPLTSARLSEKQALILAASLENHVIHPIATAIIEKAKEESYPLIPLEKIVTKPGLGIIAEAKIEGKTHQVAIGRKEFLLEKFSEKQNILQKLSSLESEKDVITLLSVDQDLFLFLLEDQIRSSTHHMMQELKKQTLEPIMLTGDRKISASFVAKQIGIEKVFADLKPEDKLQHISNLSEKKHLAMVGDGINDAPALARATVGISMGKVGSATAIDASDVILLNDDLEQLGYLFKKSKKTSRIVKQNLSLALIVILFATTPALMGLIPLWLAVILHEGGTVLVGLNSLRLLR